MNKKELIKKLRNTTMVFKEDIEEVIDFVINHVSCIDLLRMKGPNYCFIDDIECPLMSDQNEKLGIQKSSI